MTELTTEEAFKETRLNVKKCFRCDQPQDGINHIMNLPVCKEHSNWSQENIDKANEALKLDILPNTL